MSDRVTRVVSSDATDGDGLIMIARPALRAAVAGGIGRAADAVERGTLGDREVVIGHPATARVFELLKRLAASDLPMLIIGETDVGKENAAYAAHHFLGALRTAFRRTELRSAARSLVESQLFGHERGSFTGATSAHAGVFEIASGARPRRTGASWRCRYRPSCCARSIPSGSRASARHASRMVAATNRMLDKKVAAGRFR